jgi:AhpD family alkylhydroperoxidase
MRIPFSKRAYQGPGELAADLVQVVSEPAALGRLALGVSMGHGLREALMLAVTGVNDARYCRAVHRKLAKAAGLTEAQIEGALSGDYSEYSPRQQSALEFARQTAMQNGTCTSSQWRDLVAEQGEANAKAIWLTIRLMRVANLTSNAVDGLFTEWTRGRLG